jgi:hypothetical protein
MDRAQQLMLTDKTISANKALETARQEFQRGESALDRTQQANLASAAQAFQATQNEKDRAQQIMLTDKNISAQQALEQSRQEFQRGEGIIARQFESGQRQLDRDQQANLASAAQAFQATQNEKDRAQQIMLTDKNISAQQALEQSRQEFQRGEGVIARQFEAGQRQLDRDQQSSLASAAQTFQATQNEKDRAQQIMLTDKNITANKALEQARQEFQRTENAADRTQQQTLETARQTFQTTQANLDRTHQESMTRLANNLSTAQVPGTFAANVTSSTSSTINAIMADGNLTPEAKNAAIDNVIANANSTLQWGSTFYNTPMTGFARTGTGSTITPGANVAGLKAAIQSGASNADAGTAAGIAYARQMGLTPDQTVALWNQAMGTNFTRADYDRVTGGTTGGGTGGGAGGGAGGGGGGAGGDAGAQVVVYGPDGKMYSSPAAARAAGVTNYTNTPPNTGGGAGGGGGGGGVIRDAMQRDAWGREPGDPMYGVDPNNISTDGGGA